MEGNFEISSKTRKSEKDDVSVAFELLIDELSTMIDELLDEATKISKVNEQEKERLIDKIYFLKNLRGKVQELYKEWERGFLRDTVIVRPRKRRKKLRSGLCTPKEDFRVPILEALVELGGSASVSEVLDRVESKMRGKLNEYDYQKLRSGEIRWRNSAQWCRKMMVDEGLLKKGSPRGIWEISERGREYLRANSS